MLFMGFGRRIWSAISILIVMIFFIGSAEAGESMQTWRFTYRLYPVGSPGDSVPVIFTEGVDFSRIDRVDVSYIIAYRQKMSYRLDHLQETGCSSSIPGDKNEMSRQGYALLGSHTAVRTGVRQSVNGFEAEKVSLRFGSALMRFRTMVPMSMRYLGKTFREQTMTTWVAKEVQEKALFFSTIDSHSRVFKEMPLLLQLDIPALFKRLDGYIVRLEFNHHNKKFIMDLEKTEFVAVPSDFFSISNSSVITPCEE